MKKFILFLLIAITLFANFLKSQTYVVNHNVNWEAHNQNMWGPNGSPITLDQDINFFDVEFGPYNTTIGSIADLGFLGEWGAELDFDTWFRLGSHLGIHGFTTGYVDVDYPVRIKMTVPQNNSFCPGDTVSILSQYEIRNGWNLDTHFPTAGVIGLYLDFGFNLNLDATICAYSCFDASIIDVNIPYDTIPILELNSITGVFSYPCLDPTSFPPITICHNQVLPIVFSIPSIGLTGSITLPYVETHDWKEVVNACEQNLYAKGDCTWIRLDINVIDLLSTIAGFIPPPTGPAIQQFLSLLNGSIDISIVHIQYSLFNAFFTIKSTMIQEFAFEPKVWNNLSLPTPVEYFVTDPTSNDSIISEDISNEINFLACHDLHFKWPCKDFPSMDIGVMHSLTNDFTNHTFDSISFDFTISALEFWIDINLRRSQIFDILPDLCIDIPADDNDSAAVDSTICIIPTIYNNLRIEPTRLSIHIGPLFSETFPLGHIPITWFNETWELDGFNDTVFPPLVMNTNCPNLSEEDLIIHQIACYGDSTGSITMVVSGGRPPYIYSWSTGDTITTNDTTNTLSNLPAGLYYITVYDQNNCSITDSAELINLYPPLIVNPFVTNVTCEGGSDGSIVLTTNGGHPPYNYLWTNNASGPINDNLQAGNYSVTVTDTEGCDTSLAFSLIELYPLPPVNIVISPDKGCQPLLITAKENSSNQGQTYLWNFGDGSFSTNKYNQHLYNEDGTYHITCEVTSVHGCVNSQSADVIVYPKPNASFSYTPEIIDIANNFVYFVNNSDNTHNSTWDFGDENLSNETNPYHSYSDTGIYVITLYITTEYGCMDTTYKSIVVGDINTFYIPNAFSPDGDGINDIFMPKAQNLSSEYYEFKIFDRWGKMLFNTTQIGKGWDGKFNGEKCKPGVYTYYIKYLNEEKLKSEKWGIVILVR